MQSHKANFSQVFVLFMMSIGLMNHVMVIPMLLAYLKEGFVDFCPLIWRIHSRLVTFIQFIMKN